MQRPDQQPNEVQSRQRDNRLTVNQCVTKDFVVVDLNAEGPTAKPRSTFEANRQQTDSESVCHKGFDFVFWVTPAFTSVTFCDIPSQSRLRQTVLLQVAKHAASDY